MSNFHQRVLKACDDVTQQALHELQHVKEHHESLTADGKPMEFYNETDPLCPGGFRQKTSRGTYYNRNQRLSFRLEAVRLAKQCQTQQDMEQMAIRIGNFDKECIRHNIRYGYFRSGLFSSNDCYKQEYLLGTLLEILMSVLAERDAKISSEFIYPDLPEGSFELFQRLLADNTLQPAK